MTFYFIRITLHNLIQLNDFALTDLAHFAFAYVQVHVLHVRSMPCAPHAVFE